MTNSITSRLRRLLSPGKRYVFQSVSRLTSKLTLFYTRAILKSFSQYGEDLVLRKLIQKKDGFYIDIGANDANHFNNTKYFYSIGWTGINIEPDLNLYSKLTTFRKKDTNLNIGIGNKSDKLNFYQINARTLSTFDKSVADQAVAEGYKIENVYQVEVKPLASIFEQYCPAKTVDFLSLDVEGFELEVLESNDWQNFRPSFLCIEINRKTEEIYRFLQQIEYKVIYENGTNSIFYDSLSVPASQSNNKNGA